MDDWGYEISKRLDIVYSDYSEVDVSDIRAEIDAGVPDDGDRG